MFGWADTIATAKQGVQAKYAKDVYQYSLNNGNFDLIKDLLQSEEFSALHEKFQAARGVRDEKKISKGKACLGYAVTWNPPAPLSDNLDDLIEKFNDFVGRDWIEQCMWTPDQRGPNETSPDINGWHIHAYFPKGKHQNYEFKKFKLNLERFTKQEAGPTLKIDTPSTIKAVDGWLKYIAFQKTDDKDEVIAKTKAALLAADISGVLYKFPLDEENEEDEENSEYTTPFDDDGTEQSSLNSYATYPPGK